MKVLHVIPSLSPARGGPGIVLRQIMAGLSAQGAEVHCAATDDDGPHARTGMASGVPHSEAGGTVYFFPRQTRFYSFSWPMTRWLARHIRDYDVVHIHALFSWPSTATAWLARSCGVPYFIRPLGTLSSWGLATRRPALKRWSLALLERRALRCAAGVQATSDQERSEVLAACPGCRTVVIPNPVEMPAEPPVRPLRLKAEVILFISRIDPKKGLELLLRAFDQLAAGDGSLRLTVAGDGDPAYVASIHQLAASLSCRDRIRFTGNAGPEQKSVLFFDADLFVLPSYSENFGVAVAEAMAHGLPVLISPNVGICEEVQTAMAGRVVPCAVEPIARAIRELMADPQELVRMGQNGRKLAAASYASDVVARSLLSAYAAVSGSRNFV